MSTHAPQRLALLYGGRSSEHEVSIRSATEVLAAIDRTRFEPVALAVTRSGEFRTGPIDQPLGHIVADGQPVDDVRALLRSCACAFPLLHGPFGEDGTFQGLFEVYGVPYVGSGVLASALCMDKALFKHLLHTQSPPIPVVPWREFSADSLETVQGRQGICDAVEDAIGYPCFIKPANQGSSVGVSRAVDGDELLRALLLAARYDSKLLVEQGVDAREVEISVLGNGDATTVVTAPGEIVLPPGEWYDYDNKYLKDVASLQIPADLPAEVIERVRDAGLRAFRIAGCKGLARIDFLVDRNSNAVYLNEINTMPGFTTISMYPKLLEHAGTSYQRTLTRLCELALEHHAARQRLSVTR